MRLNIRLALIALFAVLISAAPYAASGTGMARAAAPVITGTLVARPQPTAPTMFFLQVGSQTLPISVSRHTRVTRSDDGRIELSDLRDGDTLRVTGEPNDQGGIDATLVQDLSLSSGPEDVVIKGLLGASPTSTTAPAIICVANAEVVGTTQPFIGTVSPCPAGQTPVSVLPTTKLLRSEKTTSSLIEPRASDKIVVMGTFVNAQFTADQVQDNSLQFLYTTFTGQVQSVTPNGETTNIAVTVSNVASNHAPFSQGAQLVLPVANNASASCVAPNPSQFPCTTVTVGSTSTHGYVPGEIAVGATIKANGLFNKQLGQFEYMAMVAAQAVIPPPVTFDVKGMLDVRPFVANGMLLVCLKNTVITSSQAHPSIGVVSPCPAGDLPVAITGNTRLINRFGNPTQLSMLRKDHTLLVTGSFVNTIFTAVVIKDLSNFGPVLTMQGKVQYVSPFTHPAYFVVRVGNNQQGDDNGPSAANSRSLVVYVQAATRIYIGHAVTNQVTVLNPGQHVVVQGVLDAAGHNMTTTYVVRVS